MFSKHAGLRPHDDYEDGWNFGLTLAWTAYTTEPVPSALQQLASGLNAP
jgi:hypothetical protein